MSVGLGPDGITIKRLPEIIEEFEKGLRTAFGQELVLDPSSPEAQLNGIYAEDISILYEALQAVYTGLHPDFSIGQMLDLVNTIRGIRRKPAVPTRVDVTFLGTPGAGIPAETLLSSGALENITFATLQAATVGGDPVTAEATITGPIEIPANTLTELVNPIIGVSSSTNPEVGTTGTDIETDAEFRLRGNSSVAFPAQAILDAVFASIANVPGVQALAVYENDTNTIDPETGQSPKSMWAVVLGGDDTEIAQAIFNRKTLGCGMDGNDTILITDSQGIDHTIRFDRPTQVPVFVDIQVQELAGWDPDMAVTIAQAIVDFAKGESSVCSLFPGYSVGDDVFASQLHSALLGIGATFSASSILVGNAAPGSDISLPITVNEISSWDTDNITVVSTP